MADGRERIKNLIINPIKLGYRHFDCDGTSLPYSFLFLITFFFLGSWFDRHSFESILAFLGS